MLFAFLEIVRGYLMPPPFWMGSLWKRGEYLARRAYHRQGYHLVATNWRHGRGEIDLIMANWRQLMFVEVKTRTITGKPLGDLIRREQARRLLGLADVYMAQWPARSFKWNFQLALVKVSASGHVSIETNELE